MIARHSVQTVLDTANVVEVISEFVQLRQRGANRLGLCPFHHEKTPSFTVSPTKNIYKCFGCGKAGNAVGFLMEHEKMSFVEAIRYLAKMYQIELEETESSEADQVLQNVKDSLFVITDRAQKYYAEQLFETSTGKSVALSYFKKRGFSEKTVRKFGLGYASDQKDGLVKQLAKEAFSIEWVKKTGLVNQYDKDFFRSRIIFPIYGLSGKVVAFAGRTMSADPKIPKYINSPETEIYEKRKVVYGLNFARKAIQKEGQCILVEGYTDVISLHQAGIENVVASSGTSLTTDQIRLIKRYTEEVLVLFDGDQAGFAAMARGVDLLLEQDMNIKIVLLPEGFDPDSYLAEVGASAFGKYLEHAAKDFILLRAEQLAKESESDPVKKSRLIDQVIQSISMIANPIKRSLYIKECSNIFGMDEAVIVQSLNQKIRQYLKRKQKEKLREVREKDRQKTDENQRDEKQKEPTGYIYHRERDVIRLIVSFGDQIISTEQGDLSVNEYILGHLASNFEQIFFDPIHKIILQELKDKTEQGIRVDSNFWVNHPQREVAQLAANLCTTPHTMSKNWAEMWKIYLQMQAPPEQNVKNDCRQAISRLLLYYYKQLSTLNQERIKAHSDDPALVNKYLQTQIRLNAKISELAKGLGTVVL